MINMGFCTWEFVLFVFFITVIYFIVEVSKRWIVLLAGSLLFFALGGWKYLLYAIILSIVFFWTANSIAKNNMKQSLLDEKQSKEESRILRRKSKKILLIMIILVVGNLVFNKYWNLVGELIGVIQGLIDSGGGYKCSGGWVLPLGLSYYTFSGMGYVLDVYWKRYPSERNFAKFLLYIIYFPHIIQGPIERYHKLQHQFFDVSRIKFDPGRVARAAMRILWGYFKKLFIADRMAGLINAIITVRPQEVPGSLQLLAILFSGVWLYADFSGYMDIAGGVSEIFGIEVNQNFNHPLSARSVPEWWRRWHMSLSSWWKDYIYMPLAVSGKFIRRCAWVKGRYGKWAGNLFKDVVLLFLIWVTTGLWHGTGITYLAWGIYFAVLFTLSVTFSPWNKKAVEKLHINTEGRTWKIFQRVRTYLLFCGGRLLTVPGSLEYSAKIVKNMAVNFNVGALLNLDGYMSMGIYPGDIGFIAAGLFLLLSVDHIEEKNKEAICYWVFRRNWFIRSVIYASIILAIFLFGIYGAEYSLSGFAYQNF